MADKPISGLPGASLPLDGTELLAVVQGGVTDRASVSTLLTSGLDATFFDVVIADTLTMSSLAPSSAVVTSPSNTFLSLGYTPANTNSALVQRDVSGNFSAGVITATLFGNASTSTLANSANALTTASGVVNVSASSAPLAGYNLIATDATHATWVVSPYVPLAGGTMTGALILNADPVTNLGAATKEYVDAISAGLSYKTAVQYGSTANLVGTYSNGASGVGATITATALGALSFDGSTPSVADRILIKDQITQFQNGIYVVTVVGDVGTAGVLTRSSDYDNSTPGEIALNNIIPIIGGSTLAGSIWRQSAPGPFTIGVTSITFAIYSTGTYVSGNGISITGNVISTNIDSSLAFSGAVMQRAALTGDITAAAGSNMTTIAANAVTYAKFQQVGAVSLLGNPTGGTTNASEITLGAGLSFSGTTLVSTGTGGTVTTVSVATANGFSGTVANPTTTPAITIIAGAITPTSVNGIVFAGSSSPALTITGVSSISGSNTGDQTITLTSDVTGSGTGSFATTIASHAVTYAKMQQASTVTLLGNPTGGLANIQEITLGSGLSFSGSTLVSTGTGGTVTSISVATANGFSGTVANPTTTPSITIIAGAITPTSVNSVVISGSATPTLAVTGTTTVSGSNTGDQTITLTGNVTGSGTGSFATTIAANAVTYAKFQQVAAVSMVGNPTGSLANAVGITLDPTLVFSGTTLQRAALTGDVTASAGSNSTTIAANVVTYAKFQQVAAVSLVGNPTGSLANASGITLGAGLSFSGTTLVATGSGGTVTSVSVATANGFSGTVANATTTPAITIIAGAITPTSVNSVVISGSATPTLAVTGTSSISGSNTGDQTITLTSDVTGSGTGSFATTIAANAVTYAKFQQVAAVSLVGNPTGSLANASGITLNTTLSFTGTTLQRAALTGDITASAGSNATTLATVNANVGTFTNATVTTNGKGLVTAISSGTAGGTSLLGTNVTQVSTSGTSETDLHSYTIPANTLTADGQFLEFETFLTATGGASSLTIRTYANGTFFTSSSSTVTATGGNLWTRTIVTRISSTKLTVVTVVTTAGSAFQASDNTSLTFNPAASFVFKITGQGAGSAACTIYNSYVRLNQ